MKPLYEPSPWQTLFHCIKMPDGGEIKEILGAGSAGPGKSQALIADPLHRLMLEHDRAFNRENPHYFGKGGSVGWGLLLRREGAMLSQMISRCARLYKAVDPGVRWKQTHQTGGMFEFSSGYKFQLGGCKDLTSWEAYQGLELDWIGFDELVQFEKEQYDQIGTRCRSSDPVLRGMCKIRAVSNPMISYEGTSSLRFSSPTWVRDYFVDPAPRGGVVLVREIEMSDGTVEKHARCYLPATVYDNPDKEFVRDYERTLRSKPPHIRKALLEGDWYSVIGQFFANWNPSLHTCPPFSIPSHWRKFRSMDWGFRSYGIVLWFAVDDEGDVWVFHELKFQNQVVDVVAGMIKAIERRYGLADHEESFLTGPADTQIKELRGESARSKEDIFADNGVYWDAADKRSLVNDAQRVWEYLQGTIDQGPAPGVVIFSTCSDLIMTLPMRQTDPKNPEKPVDGGADHSYDAFRYGISYISAGGSMYSGEAMVDGKRKKGDDDERRAKQQSGYVPGSGYG